MTDAEICAGLGVKAGDCLVGDEGYGPTIIRVTAIGEERILARALSHNGMPVEWGEVCWTLRYRDWAKLEK